MRNVGPTDEKPPPNKREKNIGPTKGKKFGQQKRKSVANKREKVAPTPTVLNCWE